MNITRSHGVRRPLSARPAAAASPPVPSLPSLRSLLAAAVLAAFAHPAFAEELRAPYFIYGAGTLQCAVWNVEEATEQEHNPHWWQLREWLFGYLSAHSLWGDDTRRVAIDKADPAFYLDWMTDYCRQNPVGPIHEGAGRLIETLMQSGN